MPPSQSIIVEPRLACRLGKTEDPIECSLHTLPKPLIREFQHVFGEKYLVESLSTTAYMHHQPNININSRGGGSGSGQELEILALPTNQHARHDLVAVGDEIEAEKDRLLNCVRIK